MRLNNISILCSSFGNSEIDVIKTLNSLERQIYKNFEVIAVLPPFKNNYKIFNRYKKKINIKIIITSKKENLAKSLNIACATSKGKFLSRIDFDDVYQREKLFKQYNYMKNNPNIDICGTNIYIKNSTDKKKKLNFPEKNKNIKNHFFFFNAICHPSVMINRKKIFKLKNLYNPNFHFAEDLELWLKYLAKNFNYYNIQENLIVVKHDYSILRDIKNYEYNLKARIKYSKEIYGFFLGILNIIIFQVFVFVSKNLNQKLPLKLIFLLRRIV
jgi:glycosyltransferase involved in cell wall biosynthesis